MAVQVTWTPARCSKLERLWNDEELSAALIAVELGVSRSAVIAKAGRLGLKERLSPEQKAVKAETRRIRLQRHAPPEAGVSGAAAPRPKPKPKPKPKRKPKADPDRDLDLNSIAMATGNRPGCQFIAGDPSSGPVTYCGREVEGRRAVYCRYHASVCRRPKVVEPVA